MNFQYIKPRIKPIYPVYQLNDELFRIGAQLSITTEFEDPEGQLLELVKVLDGREMTEIVKHMINTFPDLTPEDVVDGLDILSAENLIEETPNKVLEDLDERYHPNISYFSRYMPYDRNPMDIQEKNQIQLDFITWPWGWWIEHFDTTVWIRAKNSTGCRL